MPATSKSQRRLMGMAYAYKTHKLELDKLPPNLAKKIKDLADNMTAKELKDFAKTPETNLPDTVKENITPGGVPGMGSVSLPASPGSAENFSTQKPGSGDIPMGNAEIDDEDDKEVKKFKYIKSLSKFLQDNSNI